MNSTDRSDSFPSWKKNEDFDYSPNKKKARTEESEDEEGVSKKETKGVKEGSSVNDFAKKYLLRHGYKEGSGLGKYQNGIVQPVEASKQRGRRGFGFEATDLKDAISKYDPNSEEILIDEEVTWLTNDHPDAPDRQCLDSWIKTGKPKKCIDNNSEFCDPEIINNILTAKSVFDTISPKDVKHGRRRSNPFESIHKAIFLNRAAMKMANMDAILDRMFTEPKNMNGEKVVGPNELLYFADVCAGPGGFSEYVLFRKKWRAKGFGFTLRDEKDFLLDQFWAGPSESFEPHYGVHEDGNVYRPENIESFKEHVLKYTEGKGVHFMMADGGLDIDEKFNDQELFCKKLYLCQCIVALHIVRTGGHFVVKLFDIFTDFSVGLIYLMYRSFRQILILKPNTSRPANSERYLVCKWKRDDCKDIADHLFELNRSILEYKEAQQAADGDVLQIVPVSILTEEAKFYNYVKSSNDRLGKRQVVNLLKLATYFENVDLQDERQQELRKTCLKKWDIPDEARAEPKKCDARSKWTELLGTTSFPDLDLDLKKSKITSFESFKKNICTKHCWHYIVLSEEEHNTGLGFYLGLGRNNVHKYASGKWTKLTGCSNLCLPANTLVYGELVWEYFGSGKSQRKIFAFHIIDGMFLGGEDIRHLPFSERLDVCKLFAKAMYREICPVRVKSHHSLADMDDLWELLTLKSTKSSSRQSLCVPLEGDSFYKAFGIMFIRDTRGNWHRYLSSRTQNKYLDCREEKKNLYEDCVSEELVRRIYGDFEHCFRSKMIWWWEEGDIRESQNFQPDSTRLTKRSITEFVQHENCARKLSVSSKTDVTPVPSNPGDCLKNNCDNKTKKGFVT